MPKSKARSNKRGRKGGAAPRRLSDTESVASTVRADSKRTPPQRAATVAQGAQSLLMAAMVSLGCWGIAFTFTFFTNDANRYVYGGLAAVIAVMWSVMFSMRLRKWQQRRQA